MKGCVGFVDFKMCTGKTSELQSLNNNHVLCQNCTSRITADGGLSSQGLLGKQGLKSWEETPDGLVDHSGVLADSATFSFLVRLCGNAKALSDGKCVHHLIVKTGHGSNTFLAALLIQMYDKCEALQDAQACFINVLERNVLMWNSMIGAYGRNHHSMEAFWLFEQMQVEGVIPDKVTFICILSACISQAFITAGKSVHTRLHCNSFDSDAIVGTALVKMYKNCCSLEDAQRMLENLSFQSVVIWNSMISAYTHHSCGKEAIQLFARMLQEGISPDKVSFVSIFSACASDGIYITGKHMHTRIIHSDFESNVVIGTALVHMYSKCGSLLEARETFDNMSEQNVFSWNAMMAGYSQHRHGREAKQLFHQMQQQGVIPDNVSFVNALSSQASHAAVVQLHIQIIHGGFETDTVVATALLNMYAKCGSIDDAQQVFDCIDPSTVSWNAMIYGLVHHGRIERAFHLFKEMLAGGIVPDKITFINLLNACTYLESMVCCKVMHNLTLQSGFDSDDDVVTALVNMYGKCGGLVEAQKIFDQISEVNVILWNALIVSCVHHGNGSKALELFNQMQTGGVIPDKVTFVIIISALSGNTALTRGKWMHTCITHLGFESDLVLSNALINMYGKCGGHKDAQLMFDKIVDRNVVSWNAIISACTQHGQGQEATKYLNQMKLENMIPDEVTFSCILNAYDGAPFLPEGKRMHACMIGCSFGLDVIVSSALVNMYGKCSSTEGALMVFNTMPVRNVVSWNAMMAAYLQQGQTEDAFWLFDQMLAEGVFPDKVTFIGILGACACQAALVKGKRLHAHIMPTEFESDLANAIINMYGKCGSLKHAQSMFDKISERDVVSWNGLITVYAQHGCGKGALQLFYKMQQEGIIPDKVTFISILSACSHAGLVDEGCHLLVSMNEDYGVRWTPEHYDCMIDILGRAGQLDEVEGLMRRMPVEPGSVSWMTLLGSCRKQLDIERGLHAAEQAFELSSRSPSPYVMLSNTYSSATGGNNIEVGYINAPSMGIDPEMVATLNNLADGNLFGEVLN